MDETELGTGLEDRGLDLGAVVPGPKISRPGTPDMPWCSARTWRPAIVIQSMLKNLVSGSGPPFSFSSTSSAFGPCIW